VFGKNAEISLKELKKGSQVLVLGEKNTKVYVAKDGVKREKVSCLVRQVTFLSSRDRVPGSKQEVPNFETDDVRF
jgi:single-stranded DNA-binding protein